MLRPWLLNGNRVMGLIKRIQTGSFNAAGGTNTQAVLPVDWANSILLVQETTSDGSGAAVPGVDTATVVPTNSTTLTATQGGGFGGYTPTIYYTILEFWPGVLKSCKYYTGGAVSSVTITAVDINRAAIFANGWNNGNTSSAGQNSILTGYDFASSTSVNVRIGAGGTQSNVAFCVAEFN